MLSEMDAWFEMRAEAEGEQFDRVRAEIRFADRLYAVHPDRAEDWRPRIDEALARVREALSGGSPGMGELTHQVEAILAPIGETAKTYALLCVGHAHIDMNWQWSWPETVGLTHDTFQTMLDLMEAFPEFIFSQSQASVYALIERYNPAMFEQIRRRVAEGRWEVTASQWVEGDTNMANGESISRHLLYTRRYFAERFDLAPEDVRIDFEPDTFGHPATLPTILSRGGVEYYYHCRGSRGPHLYRWIGPDGSSLLVFNDIQWYMHFDAAHAQVAVDSSMADPLIAYAQSTGMRQMPVLYGVGDHGGGPTRRDLQRLIAMDDWPIYPRVQFSTLHHFFELAEQEATRVPEVTGERNFVFAGCYSSQARQKEANRHGEHLLMAAEAAATLGDRLADVTYPYENLEGAWRAILFDQFHDILPGSGVRETRQYTLGHAQDAQAAAGMARTNALRALGRRIDTALLREGFEVDSPLRIYKDRQEAGVAMGAGVGSATATGGESSFSVTRTSDRAYVIFNPLPSPREEVVRVKLWDTTLDPALLVVTDEAGDPIPVQVMGEGVYAGHRFLEVAFPVAVPALGYRAVCVSDRRVELGLPVPEAPSLWDGTGGALRTREREVPVLENAWLRAALDPQSGSVVSLVDKRSGREWVPEGEHLGVLEYCLEANEGMTAWVIGQFRSRQALLDGWELTQIHEGPHVQAYRWMRSLGETSLALEVSLSQGVPRLDFRLEVDWREIGDAARIPDLRVRFPLDMASPEARYEIPFGHIRRDLFDGQEVPAQRWVDLSEDGGAGMTLVNRSKYGFSVEGTALTMTLLRASVDPDPLPDLGTHVIEYGLIPHGDAWTPGEATQVGAAYNVPLVVMSSGFHEGDLPSSHAFVTVEPVEVQFGALKRGEDGGIIVRLHNTADAAVDARITLSEFLISSDMKVTEVDTLERPLSLGRARWDGDGIVVPMEPFSVTSVCITL
jgi:alpha-mannosidase